MKTLACNLPDSLHTALQRRAEAESESCDHIVATALAAYLDMPLHTLFQVSTSAALVEGLYQGAVRVSHLLAHGDFGVGTFANLDGEMVVLEGACYQISATGSIAKAAADQLIPYAVVTRFSASFRKDHESVPDLATLVRICDQLRSSDNVFYAFRANGIFHAVKTRVMKAVRQGTNLAAAASGQQEFTFENLRGTLVGIWSPAFNSAFSVPGYHFHFLSEDRQRGGHLLDCRASELAIDGCEITEMHVSLPETEQFLKADLSRNPEKDLMAAEKSR